MGLIAVLVSGVASLAVAWIADDLRELRYWEFWAPSEVERTTKVMRLLHVTLGLIGGALGLFVVSLVSDSDRTFIDWILLGVLWGIVTQAVLRTDVGRFSESATLARGLRTRLMSDIQSDCTRQIDRLLAGLSADDLIEISANVFQETYGGAPNERNSVDYLQAMSSLADCARVIRDEPVEGEDPIGTKAEAKARLRQQTGDLIVGNRYVIPGDLTVAETRRRLDLPH